MAGKIEDASQDIERLEQADFTDATVKIRTQMRAWWRWAFFVLALALSVFHLYTAIGAQLPSHQQRSFHVAFGLGLTFLLYPAKVEFTAWEARRSWVITAIVLGGLAFVVASGDVGLHAAAPAAVVVLLVQAARHLPLALAGIPVADVLLSILGFFSGLYLFFNSDEILAQAGRHDEIHIAVGAIGIMLILVAAQRVIGTPLVAVAAVMLGYAYFGEIMPGFLRHAGYSIDRIISTQFLGTEGVFGTPIAVSSTFIYMFMIFAAMLQRSGMERFFTDAAFGATGWMTGGTAKVGVLTSAFSGTITGSSVANTVGNGAFTIPMMKRSGYTGEYAGAVEAASSTGGQLAPPVMGAAAFIMIDMTGQPYSEIMKAAIIPAILFFLAQYVIIHYDSKRLGIGGLARSQLPNVRRLLLRKGYLVIPIIVIFIVLIQGYTPMFAATVAIGVAVGINVLSQIIAVAFRRWRTMEDKLTPVALLDGLVDAARLALPIIVACATAGLIAGVITLTGVGLHLGSELVALAGGQLLVTAFLAMIACLILGIGVPTTANYVITATLAAPAIMMAGDFAPEQILVAHLFVYYFGVLADITPPVCLASYAASGIARSNPMRTGVQSVRIALGGFIVPYMFLFSHELLLQDATWVTGVLAFLTAVAGIVSLGVGVVGYVDRRISPVLRVALAGAGLLLLHGSIAADAIGLVIAASIFAWQWWSGPRLRRREAALATT
ncbi:TRAP transporter permease [Actinobacteria bacterium YIM 96077]|uniref:TRAP transporter permease n=1 Tax=Phytoactinopolyspora halophila TaxID=1981511 RepID=A0A329QXF3_9ACTN|nr:TRAP transporter permease [Phytoactinopolyspora halophila]AYY12818.1 TRAP transporter permease [Actinobacteria bacterium YIM 96077]RAW16389.1 TRAP transporter permease [Phytoactinopolyspora halophila]